MDQELSLPQAFINRMKSLLAQDSCDFFKALSDMPRVSIRINTAKHISSLPFSNQKDGQVEWMPDAYYIKERPIFTLDPLFHAGAYYVQEASSMFLHQILCQLNIINQNLRILDLCAAPGGKSTLIASEMSPSSVLISNEVIRQRSSILKENIIKWGCPNVVVTNNDPADFKPLKAAFDIIVVDAPCSGEGMFRKDSRAISEWSEDNLILCRDRQKRILNDIWTCLKPGGHLIYSTCTYNPDENEGILEWLNSEKGATSVPIKHEIDGITDGNSNMSCYHFYPHRIKGEGFFVGVVQKSDDAESTSTRIVKHKTPNIQLPKNISDWLIQPELYSCFTFENIIGLIPKSQTDFLETIRKTLYIQRLGCEVVEQIGKDIKPLHQVAVSTILNIENTNHCELNLEDAMKYLKKENVNIPNKTEGWTLMTYDGVALGWAKNMGQRVNNYYPKEWRIRMDITK